MIIADKKYRNLYKIYEKNSDEFKKNSKKYSLFDYLSNFCTLIY